MPSASEKRRAGEARRAETLAEDLLLLLFQPDSHTIAGETTFVLRPGRGGPHRPRPGRTREDQP